MKRVYTIEGLDCANCALKVERGLNKDSNILNAAIDFPTHRLYVTYKENEYEFNKINELVKSFDDDAFLLEPKQMGKTKIFDKDMIVLLIRIGISTILFALGLIFEHVLFKGNYAVYVPVYAVSALIVIYDITWKAIQNIIHLRNPFDKNLLLTIACVGAFCLVFLGQDAFMEGVMVIILSQVGEVFESIATKKSTNSIVSAVDMRGDSANLIKDENIIVVKPEELNIGDLILIKVGEIVPCDATVVKGDGSFDTSSLTGEFVPVSSKEGMKVLSGYILVRGSVTCKVDKLSKDSAASKVIDLVANSGERKAKANRFIDKFAQIYTPIVFVLAVLFATVPAIICKAMGINTITSVIGQEKGVWEYFLYSALSFIVIACPCAIVISVPLSFFSGIGLAGKNGIVIKGANYFDKLCEIDTLVSDKTGTLTFGSFKLTKQALENDVDEVDFLEYLLAAESRSNHPVAKAIIGSTDCSDLSLLQEDYQEIAGMGVSTNYLKKHILVGNSKLMEKYSILVPKVNENGTVIYLAVDGKYLGYVVLGDEIKPGSFVTVKELKKSNIRVVMLTGDNENSASLTAKELGINEFKYSLLPEQKIEALDKLISESKKGVAFVGDGINDAPSIICSNVGIAMGGTGSDLAVDNADIVIMNDNPKKVVDAIKIAKATRRKAVFNIVVALAVKIILMILSGLGVLGSLGMLISVIADTGLTVLLILNSLLLLYKKIK